MLLDNTFVHTNVRNDILVKMEMETEASGGLEHVSTCKNTPAENADGAPSK